MHHDGTSGTHFSQVVDMLADVFGILKETFAHPLTTTAIGAGALRRSDEEAILRRVKVLRTEQVEQETTDTSENEVIEYRETEVPLGKEEQPPLDAKKLEEMAKLLKQKYGPSFDTTIRF